MGFLSHNFVSKYAKNQSRALKPRIIALFPKKQEPKMARRIGAQDQVNLAKKAKIQPIMMSPTENPIPKTKKIFFQSELEDLPHR